MGVTLRSGKKTDGVAKPPPEREPSCGRRDGAAEAKVKELERKLQAARSQVDGLLKQCKAWKAERRQWGAQKEALHEQIEARDQDKALVLTEVELYKGCLLEVWGHIN